VDSYCGPIIIVSEDRQTQLLLVDGPSYWQTDPLNLIGPIEIDWTVLLLLINWTDYCIGQPRLTDRRCIIVNCVVLDPIDPDEWQYWLVDPDGYWPGSNCGLLLVSDIIIIIIVSWRQYWTWRMTQTDSPVDEDLLWASPSVAIVTHYCWAQRWRTDPDEGDPDGRAQTQLWPDEPSPVGNWRRRTDDPVEGSYWTQTVGRRTQPARRAQPIDPAQPDDPDSIVIDWTVRPARPGPVMTQWTDNEIGRTTQ